MDEGVESLESFLMEVLFEKGGVNFSIISGDKMPKSATELRPDLEGRKYTALGISLVLHPENPFVPTTHANVRFFHS